MEENPYKPPEIVEQFRQEPRRIRGTLLVVLIAIFPLLIALAMFAILTLWGSGLEAP